MSDMIDAAGSGVLLIGLTRRALLESGIAIAGADLARGFAFYAVPGPHAPLVLSPATGIGAAFLAGVAAFQRRRGGPAPLGHVPNLIRPADFTALKTLLAGLPGRRVIGLLDASSLLLVEQALLECGASLRSHAAAQEIGPFALGYHLADPDAACPSGRAGKLSPLVAQL